MFGSPEPQCCSEQARSLAQHGPRHSLKEDGYRHYEEERVVGEHQPEAAQPLKTAELTKKIEVRDTLGWNSCGVCVGIGIAETVWFSLPLRAT